MVRSEVRVTEATCTLLWCDLSTRLDPSYIGPCSCGVACLLTQRGSARAGG